MMMSSSDTENSSAESSEDEQTIYDCRDCSTYFSNKYSLMRHLKKEHGEKNDEKYKCYFCEGKRFTYCDDLKIHTERHHNLDRFKKFPCKICGKKFEYQYRLDRHELSHHSTLKTDEPAHHYECMYCTMKSNSKIILYRHILINHDNKCKLNSKCPFCEENFKRKHKWFEHVMTCHPEVFPFECNICHQLFGTVNDFMGHLINHVEVTLATDGMESEEGIRIEAKDTIIEVEDVKIETGIEADEAPSKPKRERVNPRLVSELEDSSVRFDQGRTVRPKPELKLYTIDLAQASTSRGDEAAAVSQEEAPRVKFLKLKAKFEKYVPKEGLKLTNRPEDCRPIFTCFLCFSKPRFTRNELKKHYAEAHRKCVYCNQRFEHADQILKHLTEDHPE